MLSVNNLNYYQPKFMSRNVKLNCGLEDCLEIFKNKIMTEEKYISGYVAPEIKTAIEDKIQLLKLKSRNTDPKHEADLIKPLLDAINGNYDITGTYLALGEFEKKLSQIDIVG